MKLRQLCKKRIYLLLLMGYSYIMHAQIEKSHYSVSLGANVALNFTTGKNLFRQNFPGIKAFVGINAHNQLRFTHKVNGILNIGSNITIYNKSLGNSLNLGYQDNQIDWTSNFNLGIGHGLVPNFKLLQSINNSPYYNLRHQNDCALMIGANFILNNHGRNQTNGTIAFTVKDFSLVYYNDGGPVLNGGIGDTFDRYWTGGLMLYWHNSEGKQVSDTTTIIHSYNKIEFSFDQFTGYRPQMYEILGIFGADLQDYDVFFKLNTTRDSLLFNLKPTKGEGYDYNASQYKLTYNFDPFIGAHVGVMGSLRSKKQEKYFALQDIIHKHFQHPIHPNKESNRIQLGINYNNQLWER